MGIVRDEGAAMNVTLLARTTGSGPTPGGGAGPFDRGEKFGRRGGVPGLVALLLFLGGTMGLGALMGQLTQAEIDTWYRTLRAPPGTPPDWVFPVAWTPLYAMMAIAAWRVWLRTGFLRLPWWFVQLALNAAWTPAFFSMRSPVLGLFVIVPFWLAIAATIRAFRPIDRVAAWLLLPYLAWVTYAAYLNLGFAWLN
jgi:tryptophan-rich sensory protein